MQRKGVGLALILDDINGLASMQPFADWLKSLIDEIALDAEPTALCLIIVGLEERRQSLIELQPSLARAFKLFQIQEIGDATFAEDTDKRIDGDDASERCHQGGLRDGAEVSAKAGAR